MLLLSWYDEESKYYIHIHRQMVNLFNNIILYVYPYGVYLESFTVLYPTQLPNFEQYVCKHAILMQKASWD